MYSIDQCKEMNPDYVAAVQPDQCLLYNRTYLNYTLNLEVSSMIFEHPRKDLTFRAMKTKKPPPDMEKFPVFYATCLCWPYTLFF